MHELLTLIPSEVVLCAGETQQLPGNGQSNPLEIGNSFADLRGQFRRILSIQFRSSNFVGASGETRLLHNE